MASLRQITAFLVLNLLAHGNCLPFEAPIVNLGYERHQALTFNETGRYYTFSNIRYAEPPIDNLRFRQPVAPVSKSSTVRNGFVEVMCPQVLPAWTGVAAAALPAEIAGQEFNTTAANAFLAQVVPPAMDRRTTEDCLFLDVYVPQIIFHKTAPPASAERGAPVLVWIHGGGFVSGSKTIMGNDPYSPDGFKSVYNPAGLLKAGQDNNPEGLIYVAINYRLGAFGFLAGADVQADGVANAGLYDQRRALEWVQKYIHLFGGDRSRVTVLGQSAGAASIMHQMTAFDGEDAPFAQAIVQSPGFLPRPGNQQSEAMFANLLHRLDVSSLQAVRQLPSSILINATLEQIFRSPFSTFTYGPTVDGRFTPALPGHLFLQGSFDNKVKLLLAHNSDEGLSFADPRAQGLSVFESSLRSIFPNISNDVVNYISTELYPPVFNGSYGYSNAIERQALTISDLGISCNIDYLNSAFSNRTYTYEFSVFPGLHGEELDYTFATGPGSPSEAPYIKGLQGYITSFVISGVPQVPGMPDFPVYGANRHIINFNTTISQTQDDTVASRCAWWQKALYY